MIGDLRFVIMKDALDITPVEDDMRNLVEDYDD
jgi:hypothetical protein